MNGKRHDDFTPYLWKSTDYGATWTSIVNDLPLGPVNVIKEDPENPDLLYVGTDLSAYTSIDGGQSWKVLSDELPASYVHDIVIHPRDDIMVAATHGRGMFALDVRPIRQLTPEIVTAAVHVLDPGPARLARGNEPAVRPSIYYWLSTAGAVTVTVKDARGQTVRDLEGTSDAGLNVAHWDLSGRAQTQPQGQGGGFGRRGPPPVAPGIYTVEVRQGGNTASAQVVVSR